MTTNTKKARRIIMITFEPFWDYIRKHNITTYQLIEEYDLNPVEIYRLKHDHNYTLVSIESFCKLFSCQPSDLIAYKEDNVTKDT